MIIEREIDLPANGWSPRLYQQKTWNYVQNGGKRAVIVHPRRHGKDIVCLNFLADKAITERVGSYWHVFPEYQQAKKAIWMERTSAGVRYLEIFPGFTNQDIYVESVNNTDLFIQLKNGSTYRMVGSENPDNLVGANPVGIIFSEFGGTPLSAWHYLQPIVEANDGWVIFNGTPRGRNHFKKFYDFAISPEGIKAGWFGELLTCETALYHDEKTGQLRRVISQEKIDAIRKEPGMTEEFIQQEFYCSWIAPQGGAYYATVMMQAQYEGRIGRVPHDPMLEVHTAWDFGYNDSTTIWFFQVERAGAVRIIDFYSEHEEAISHYIRVCRDKEAAGQWIFGKHHAPWDVDQHSIQTGSTINKVARSLGFHFTPCKQTIVDTGIEAVRALFPRLWFDDRKCETGLDQLRAYRKSYNKKTDTFGQPVHDNASHAADALRTLAWGVGTKHSRIVKPQEDREPVRWI